MGCLPVPAGESVPEMVRDLLSLVREAGAKVKLVLLDREFFSTGVIQELTRMNVDYLMPCTNTPGVVEALNEFAAERRPSVSDHHPGGIRQARPVPSSDRRPPCPRKGSSGLPPACRR